MFTFHSARQEGRRPFIEWEVTTASTTGLPTGVYFIPDFINLVYFFLFGS